MGLRKGLIGRCLVAGSYPEDRDRLSLNNRCVGLPHAGGAIWFWCFVIQVATEGAGLNVPTLSYWFLKGITLIHHLQTYFTDIFSSANTFIHGLFLFRDSWWQLYFASATLRYVKVIKTFVLFYPSKLYLFRNSKTTKLELNIEGIFQEFSLGNILQ